MQAMLDYMQCNTQGRSLLTQSPCRIEMLVCNDCDLLLAVTKISEFLQTILYGHNLKLLFLTINYSSLITIIASFSI